MFTVTNSILANGSKSRAKSPLNFKRASTNGAAPKIQFNATKVVSKCEDCFNLSAARHFYQARRGSCENNGEQRSVPTRFAVGDQYGAVFHQPSRAQLEAWPQKRT